MVKSVKRRGSYRDFNCQPHLFISQCFLGKSNFGLIVLIEVVLSTRSTLVAQSDVHFRAVTVAKLEEACYDWVGELNELDLGHMSC